MLYLWIALIVLLLLAPACLALKVVKHVRATTL